MTPKSFLLSQELFDYIMAHNPSLDPVATALIEETQALGSVSGMQIAPEQGAFLTVLTKLLGVRSAIEVGTFTGYSALCIARGMNSDGRLLCCDVSEEWTAIGQKYWQQAGIDGQIDLRIAPASETIADLLAATSFDLAFIDADKPNYITYYEALVERMRPNGVILVDNTLWDGAVVDGTNQEENTVAIRQFNDHVSADPRTESVMLPISDGLTMVRVRGE